MKSIVRYSSGESQEFNSQGELTQDNTRSRWGVGLATAACVGLLAVPAAAVFGAVVMGLYFGGIAGVITPQVSLAMIAIGGAIGAVSGGFIARDAARDSMDESLRSPSAPQNFSEKLASYRHNLTNLDNDDLPEWRRPDVKPGTTPR